MNTYLSNAFSLQMLQGRRGTLNWEIISQKKFNDETADAHSRVGKVDIANILGVEFNREPICLKDNDLLYIAQVYGGKLPMGARELPVGCGMKYYKVEINDSKMVI